MSRSPVLPNQFVYFEEKCKSLLGENCNAYELIYEIANESKIHRIAISGKMCSGKTTLSNILKERYGLTVISFADTIKDIATNVFSMEQKDRKLLQNIGTVFRKRDENVWVNDFINRANSTLSGVICDDLRYKNEFDRLKSEGFFMIRLEPPDYVRLDRMRKLYPDTYQQHMDNSNHPSENDLDDCIYEFDLVINDVPDVDEICRQIDEFFK